MMIFVETLVRGHIYDLSQ